MPTYDTPEWGTGRVLAYFPGRDARFENVYCPVKKTARIGFIATCLLLAGLPLHVEAGHQAGRALTQADRRVARVATHLAGSSPARAAAWLQHQHGVASVGLGPDWQTLDVHFVDGAELGILPRTQLQASFVTPHLAVGPVRRHVRTADAAQGHALVLEPFAHLLGHDGSFGQEEADLLTQAGFHVDVLRDASVTIGSLQNLASYSVVYMETHSNVLPDGDAIVVSGDTNAGAYPALFQDASVMQATVAGDPSMTLYLAVKSRFIQQHVGTWPDSSIVFINGCAVMNAPKFVGALQGRNVSSLVGWDNESFSSVDEAAASFIFQHLSQGQSVATAVNGAIGFGLGTSVVNGKVAHLSFTGDGQNTLANALAEATPTPIPTATSTSTVTPTPTPTVAPATATATPHAVKKHKKKHKKKPAPKPTATPKPTSKPTVKHKSKPTTKKHKHTITCKKGSHVVRGKCVRCKNGKCSAKR